MTGTQVDLFLDSLIDAPIKDDRALMEFPFFSLQKAPRLKPLIYDDGKVKIEVKPGERGIATIWDKDVLIYIASIINDRLERGLPVEKTVRFNAHNFLQVTGRSSGKRAYELLLDAMFRLRSTTILTTIEANETKERRGFGWIETFRVLERKTKSGKKVMAACEITLNDWMFRAIAQDRRVLTIHSGYFKLTMGLKRRLYELARKHCGNQGRWVIALPKLIEKCGSVLEPRFFKPQLRKVVTDDDLPEYHIAMSFDPKTRAEALEGGFESRRWASNERILVIVWPRSKPRVAILPAKSEGASATI
jgi:plasmid replication initiation protein